MRGAWWHYADDLRLYVWVQFMPLVTLSLVVALFPGRYDYRHFLLYGLGCYLLAALGLLFVYLMLRRREPIRAAQPSSSGDGAALA